MKKAILILTLLSGISLQGESQQFTTSFGVQHQWNVPTHVSNAVYNNYHGYDWVHANRVNRGGRLFFDLVLQRGDVFVEVSVRNDGYIATRVYRDYYPLHEHVCSSHCGYHTTYYTTYYSNCHSQHHHNHNHVAYVRPPYGHAYGHYKNNHGNHKKHQKHGQNNHVHSKHDDGHRDRRDRYHDTQKHENGRRNTADNKKGRSGNYGQRSTHGKLVSRTH